MSDTPLSPCCRPLRADAQRNYDRLIEAADAEFTAVGATASLEDIAKRAGVGIGTLYRHFPTREDLIAAVLNESNAVIVARAKELATADDPARALATWLRELVEHVTVYRGLTGPVATSYVTDDKTQLCTTCDAITAAGALLLARAQAANQIRADADMREVILTAHSAAWIAEQTKDPSAVDRLLGILFHGLRVVDRSAYTGANGRASRPGARRNARRRASR
jgi:AcrR family transcriptional regulator